MGVVFFFGTSVYPRCNTLKRLELWEDLQATDTAGCPWMVGGYFNVILNEEESYEGWISYNMMLQMLFNVLVPLY